MPALKGSKTEDNLKTAFAGESQANRRYLYFAQKADVEDGNDTQLGQVVEGLIDGLERDVGHLSADLLVDALGGRVGCVALEGPKDALTLGRDLATVCPEQLRQRFE